MSRPLRMIAWIRLLCAFGILSAISSAHAPAYAAANGGVDCQSCAPEIEALREQQLLQEKTTKLLGNNKAYLAGLSSWEASKYLKVESNIMMILKKLDVIKRDTERAQEAIIKKGCDGCLANHNEG